MAIEISNMFKNCASLTKVEFPNLSTSGSIYSGCGGSSGYSSKKQLVQTMQNQCKDIFELYCKLYPEHKSDWESLLKMNENNYQHTVSSIMATYNLDLPDVD
jgi:hypothetical protein